MLINSNKFMNQKTYQTWRIVIVFILAMVFSQSIVRGNYIIPVVLMVASSLILWYLRGRVKGVLADERDYAMAGKAALLAIQVFGWLAAVATLIFYSQRAINPMYETIGLTLSYSVLFLFLVYGVVFRYYNKFKFDKKTIYLFVAILAVLLFTLFGVRLLSGEDDWICQNGQWQKHGNPSFVAPSVECK
jgi:uncharacterized membrane protein